MRFRAPRFTDAVTLGLWVGFAVGLAGGLLDVALHGYPAQGLWLNALRTLAEALLRGSACGVALGGAAALVGALEPPRAALAVYVVLVGVGLGAGDELDLRELWWISDLEFGGVLLLLLLLPAQRVWARRALPVRSTALPLLALAATVAGAWGLTAARRSADPDRLNVILLLIDTLRADHVGSLGYPRPTSPTLDRLAAEGVLFRRAISPASSTRPAMASIWTGLYPARHGVARRERGLDERFVTGAELAREVGYRTAAFCPNPNLDRSLGQPQGWDVYVDRALRMWKVRKDLSGWARYETASHVQERALRFIDEAPERPFLLWMHYRDVHAPYLPPPPYDRLFRSAAPRPMIEEEAKRRSDYLTLPDDGNDLNHYIDRYDGGIRYTDDRIAEFLTALEARGLRERTVLIVAADHGEEFLDHGGWEHGGRVYEELVHVPLIVVWPGSENRVEDRPVSTLSIFATLAGILGVEPPENDGVDLGPLLRGDGEVALPDVVLSQTGGRRPPWRDAVRQSDWKLVTDETGRRIALYDLAVDPDERRDRSPNEGDRAEQLAEERGALGLAVVRGAVSSGPADEVDEDLRERLRALGYSQ